MSAPEKPMTDAITLDALIQAIADRFPDATEDDCRAAAEFVGVNGPFNSLRAATCAIFLLGRRSQRAEWAGKWVIDKPVWEEDTYKLAENPVAMIGRLSDEPQWHSGLFVGRLDVEYPVTHAEQSEARAWVEAEVARAWGAEVADE